MSTKFKRYSSRFTSILVAVLMLVTTISATAANLDAQSSGATETNWTLRGTFNSWSSSANKFVTDDDGVTSTSVSLDENTNYKFKLVDGSTWYGNNGTMTSTNCSGWTFTTSGGDAGITTTIAGTYVFKLDISTKKLSVVYPSEDEPTDPTTTEPKKEIDETDTRTIYFDETAIKSGSPRFSIKASVDSQSAWYNMTNVDGNIYSADVPNDYTTICIYRFDSKVAENSDKDDAYWNRSHTLTLTEANMYKATAWNGKYFEGEWANYNVPETSEDTSSDEDSSSEKDTEPTVPSSEETTPSTGNVTYYFTNNYNWSEVYAYVWKEPDKTELSPWPGIKLSSTFKNSDNQDVYSVVVDRDKYNSIIFGNNGDQQTVDIDLTKVKENAFYIDGGSGKALTVGTWSYVAPSTDPSVPDPSSESSSSESVPPVDEVDAVKAAAYQNAIWFDVQPETPGSTSILGLVKAYDGSSMRFYIPSGVDTTALHIYHSYNKVVINGTKIESGKAYDVTSWNGKSVQINDGTAKTLKIFQSTAKTFLTNTYNVDSEGNFTSLSDLPTSTNSSLTSKGSVNKTGMYMALKNDGSVLQAAEKLSSIKGRGNSSWEASYKCFGKYAYNLKLTSKIKLADNATKSKKWSFLANNADESMMRNTLVYNLGDSIGLEDSPMSDVYDVYNNGNYLGSYLASEKVEVGSSALVAGTNIEDLNEADPENASYDFGNPTQKAKTGYSVNEAHAKGFYKYDDGIHTPENFKEGDFLLEFELDERFADEECGFISNQGQQVVLKTPEVASRDEVLYIMDRFNAAEAVAYAQAKSISSETFAAGSISVSNGKYTYTSSVTDYTVTVDGYDKLIDTESFAQNYLIQEFTENLDGVATSFYVNLSNEDALFTATPLWDFDWTMGQYGGTKKTTTETKSPSNTNQWFIKDKCIYAKDGGNTGTKNFVARLNTIPDFWTRVQIQWQYNVYPQIQKLYGSTGLIKTTYSDMYRASVTMNEDRYHFIADNPISSWGNADTGSTWEEAVSFLDNWTKSRATWMNNNIGSAPAYTKDADAAATIEIAEGDDIITATATASGISNVKSSDYTYKFTVVKNGETKKAKTITQLGNPEITLATEYAAGDVYDVTVDAYPSMLGMDTGFVLSADASHTVVDPSTPSLKVTPTEKTIYVGQSLELTVKAVNVTGEVTWTTNDETVATVENGVVTAVAEGTATITASADDLTATCTVTVTEEPVVPSTIVTVYFTNNKNWSSVNAYVWNDSTKDNMGKWPGTAIKKVATNSQNQDIYTVTFDSAVYDSVIFNGDSKQTVDINGINSTIGYYIDSDKGTDSIGNYYVKSYSVVEPSVVLKDSEVALKTGETYTITPKSSAGTLSYETSDSKVASVSEEGVITALAEGTAKVTVSAKGSFATETATIDVTVADVDDTSATVNGKEFNVGDEVVFLVKAQFDKKITAIQGYIDYSNAGLEVQSFKYGDKVVGGLKISSIHDQSSIEGQDIVSYNAIIDETEAYNFTKLSTIAVVKFTVTASGDWTISNNFTAVEDVNFDKYVKNGVVLAPFTAETETLAEEPAPEKYTVTFKNFDGTVISTKDYTYGETVEVPSETPVKPADKQNTYAFSGWTPEVSATAVEDAEYTATFKATPVMYSVTVSAVNGTVTGCPEDAVAYGTEVTLKAKSNEGYTFEGFYVDGKRVSASSTYTFTVEGNKNVVAQFASKPSSSLKVMVLGGDSLKVKIGANGTETVQSVFYYNRDVKTGQYVTLTATGLDGFEFMYWISDNGKIVSKSQKYGFTFVGNTSVTAVYAQTSAHTITFISGANQVNSSMCYPDEASFSVPNPYSRSGYEFTGWSLDGGKTICTASDIYNASLEGNVVVEAIYTPVDVKYALTVNNGYISKVGSTEITDKPTSGSYSPVSSIVVNANEAAEGKKFAYWTDQNGAIKSYSESYDIFLNGDTTLEAVYVDENVEVEEKVVFDFTMTYDGASKLLSNVVVANVPDKYIIQFVGLYATSNESIGSSAETLTSSTAEYVKKSKDFSSLHDTSDKYTWNKSNVQYGDSWFIRPYVICLDENGEAFTFESDVVYTSESIF